jgi:hypothetical protein
MPRVSSLTKRRKTDLNYMVVVHSLGGPKWSEVAANEFKSLAYMAVVHSPNLALKAGPRFITISSMPRFAFKLF